MTKPKPREGPESNALTESQLRSQEHLTSTSRYVCENTLEMTPPRPFSTSILGVLSCPDNLQPGSHAPDTVPLGTVRGGGRAHSLHPLPRCQGRAWRRCGRSLARRARDKADLSPRGTARSRLLPRLAPALPAQRPRSVLISSAPRSSEATAAAQLPVCRTGLVPAQPAPTASPLRASRAAAAREAASPPARG